MAIGLSYKTQQISPGIVCMSGVVVFLGGFADPLRSYHPGLRVVSSFVGRYDLQFLDGVTPGITVPVVDFLLADVADPPLFAVAILEQTTQAGSNALLIEIKDSTGLRVAPPDNSAMVYQIHRTNTSIRLP